MTDNTPLFPDVTLNLTSSRQDGPSLTATVGRALDLSGHPGGADRFAGLAQNCGTYDDLWALIRSTITVL